jgi:hypothetical protein
LHCGAFGVQTVQEPARQAPEAQVRLLPHAPARLQVCCVIASGRHCVLPGTHMPEHTPVDPEQTYGQTMSLFQVPVLSQLCWVLPTH